MRQRKWKAYWKRLGELAGQELSRDERLQKLGAARDRAGRGAAGLVRVSVAEDGALRYELDRAKLRAVRQREGRYLLRTNLSAADPALVWRCYRQLVAVEESFRTLKGDLGLRPIFHRKADRIEAHLFVAFLAYCLSTTLRQRLRAVAGGLMPRVVLEARSGGRGGRRLGSLPPLRGGGLEGAIVDCHRLNGRGPRRRGAVVEQAGHEKYLAAPGQPERMEGVLDRAGPVQFARDPAPELAGGRPDLEPPDPGQLMTAAGSDPEPVAHPHAVQLGHDPRQPAAVGDAGRPPRRQQWLRLRIHHRRQCRWVAGAYWQ